MHSPPGIWTERNALSMGFTVPGIKVMLTTPDYGPVPLPWLGWAVQRSFLRTSRRGWELGSTHCRGRLHELVVPAAAASLLLRHGREKRDPEECVQEASVSRVTWNAGCLFHIVRHREPIISYVGLDIHVKNIAICILDENAKLHTWRQLRTEHEMMVVLELSPDRRDYLQCLRGSKHLYSWNRIRFVNGGAGVVVFFNNMAQCQQCGFATHHGQFEKTDRLNRRRMINALNGVETSGSFRMCDAVLACERNWTDTQYQPHACRLRARQVGVLTSNG